MTELPEELTDMLVELVEAAEERGLRSAGHDGMLDYDPRPIGDILADMLRALVSHEEEP
jgi:hypothetical protein